MKLHRISEIIFEEEVRAIRWLDKMLSARIKRSIVFILAVSVFFQVAWATIPLSESTRIVKGEKHAIYGLINALNDSDPEVREVASLSILKLLQTTGGIKLEISVKEELTKILLQKLNDSNAKVIEYSAYGLVELVRDFRIKEELMIKIIRALKDLVVGVFKNPAFYINQGASKLLFLIRPVENLIIVKYKALGIKAEINKILDDTAVLIMEGDREVRIEELNFIQDVLKSLPARIRESISVILINKVKEGLPSATHLGSEIGRGVITLFIDDLLEDPMLTLKLLYWEIGRCLHISLSDDQIVEFNNIWIASKMATEEVQKNFVDPGGMEHPWDDFAYSVAKYMMDSQGFLKLAISRWLEGDDSLLRKFDFIVNNIFTLPFDGKKIRIYLTYENGRIELADVDLIRQDGNPPEFGPIHLRPIRSISPGAQEEEFVPPRIELLRMELSKVVRGTKFFNERLELIASIYGSHTAKEDLNDALMELYNIYSETLSEQVTVITPISSYDELINKAGWMRRQLRDKIKSLIKELGETIGVSEVLLTEEGDLGEYGADEIGVYLDMEGNLIYGFATYEHYYEQIFSEPSERSARFILAQKLAQSIARDFEGVEYFDTKFATGSSPALASHMVGIKLSFHLTPEERENLRQRIIQRLKEVGFISSP